MYNNSVESSTNQNSIHYTCGSLECETRFKNSVALSSCHTIFVVGPGKQDVVSIFKR